MDDLVMDENRGFEQPQLAASDRPISSRSSYSTAERIIYL